MKVWLTSTYQGSWNGRYVHTQRCIIKHKNKKKSCYNLFLTNEVDWWITINKRCSHYTKCLHSDIWQNCMMYVIIQCCQLNNKVLTQKGVTINWQSHWRAAIVHSPWTQDLLKILLGVSVTLFFEFLFIFSFVFFFIFYAPSQSLLKYTSFVYFFLPMFFSWIDTELTVLSSFLRGLIFFYQLSIPKVLYNADWNIYISNTKNPH